MSTTTTYVCPDCEDEFGEPGTCPDCGSELVPESENVKTK